MLEYTDKQFLSQIARAVNNNKLVLFVGAGVSKLCGLPLWYDLAVKLLDYCVEDDSFKFTSKDRNLLLSSVKDSRELVTIASNIISKKGKDLFYGQIHKHLSVDTKRLGGREKQNSSLIPSLIKSLANTVITTNADTIIDEQYDGKQAILYTQKDIDKFDVKEEKQVFHIHGSIKKPEDMVFTITQYLERYNHPVFRSKMEKIFNNPDPDMVILIVGYSLSELQLLDLVIKNDTLPKEERQKKTFLLKGYYSYEENVFEAESEYYKAYGITLLSYSMDKKSYQELVYVLDEINKYVKSSSKQNIHQIQSVLKLFNKKPSDADFTFFLNVFSEFDNLKRDYSFSELLKSPFLSEWVSRMINCDVCFFNYFDIDKNLSKTIEDEYGFPGCRFITRIKLSNFKEKKKIKDYFRTLLTCFIENNIYFTNRTASMDICRAIMNNPEYLSMPEAYKFIKIFNEQSYRDYWILFLCHQNDILLKVGKKILLKFSSLVLKSFYEKDDKEYYFNLFFDTYANRISVDIPNEIIRFCEKIIEKEVGEKEKYFCLRDSFEELSVNDADYYPIYKIYKMLLFCLNGLNDTEIILLYDKYKKSSLLFYKQLSIYLVNTRYSVLENSFFEDLPNYAFDRKYFTEIYSCFYRNKNYISESKITQILDYIEKIKFKDYSEIWNITSWDSGISAHPGTSSVQMQ